MKNIVLYNNKEKVNLNYKSQLKIIALQELLISNEKDKVLQYTSAGIHKDDIEFLIGNYPIKKFGNRDSKIFFNSIEISSIRSVKS